MIRFFGSFLHNNVAHPLMTFLPEAWGAAVHDWTLQFGPPEDDGPGYADRNIEPVNTIRFSNIKDYRRFVEAMRTVEGWSVIPADDPRQGLMGHVAFMGSGEDETMVCAVIRLPDVKRGSHVG